MYNEDDAVAKIDGYVISVAKGVKYLGEKHLVRIETVGRSSAAASIVGVEAEAEGADPAEEAAPKRSRGRRGGRGRRPKAAAE